VVELVKVVKYLEGNSHVLFFTFVPCILILSKFYLFTNRWIN